VRSTSRIRTFVMRHLARASSSSSKSTGIDDSQAACGRGSGEERRVHRPLARRARASSAARARVGWRYLSSREAASTHVGGQPRRQQKQRKHAQTRRARTADAALAREGLARVHRARRFRAKKQSRCCFFLLRRDAGTYFDNRVVSRRLSRRPSCVRLTNVRAPLF